MEGSEKHDDKRVWVKETFKQLQGPRIVAIRSLVILCILLVAVSGAAASTPPDQSTLLQQTDDELSEETILVLFETVLEDQGIDVETVELNEDEDTLYVEYYTTGMTERQVEENIAFIAGTYAGAIDEGVTTDRMEVTALDSVDNSETASWYVETEWAESYNAGEMSSTEFVTRVFLTLEPVEN